MVGQGNFGTLYTTPSSIGQSRGVATAVADEGGNIHTHTTNKKKTRHYTRDLVLN